MATVLTRASLSVSAKRALTPPNGGEQGPLCACHSVIALVSWIRDGALTMRYLFRKASVPLSEIGKVTYKETVSRRMDTAALKKILGDALEDYYKTIVTRPFKVS